MRSIVFLGLALAGFSLSGCGGGGTARDAGNPGMDAGARVDSSTPACGTAAPEDNLAACSDGCDNESDGFADCDDFGCCGSRTDCPATSSCGMMMPAADGGTVSACATAGPEDSAATCGDGCDNEPDGFADCNDFDCCDVVSCGADTACGRASMRDGGPPSMRCDGGGAVENSAALCGDGVDNDCDGFADCSDFGCCSRVTCAASTPCGMRDGGTPTDAGPGAMACAGPMTMEVSLAQCSDGCSNDGDRFADCDDFDCCGVRTDCPATSSCGRRGDAGPARDAGPAAMACPGPVSMENTAAACSDGCSNDGDRFADCNDFDCCGLVTCGMGTSCFGRDAG